MQVPVVVCVRRIPKTAGAAIASTGYAIAGKPAPGSWVLANDARVNCSAKLDSRLNVTEQGMEKHAEQIEARCASWERT